MIWAVAVTAWVALIAHGYATLRFSLNAESLTPWSWYFGFMTMLYAILVYDYMGVIVGSIGPEQHLNLVKIIGVPLLLHPALMIRYVFVRLGNRNVE